MEKNLKLNFPRVGTLVDSFWTMFSDLRWLYFIRWPRLRWNTNFASIFLFTSFFAEVKWRFAKKWWETFEVKNLIKGWQVDLGQAEVNEAEARVSIPCRLNSETTPTRLSDKKEFPHFDNLGIFCCDVSIACSEIPADPEDEANPRR